MLNQYRKKYGEMEKTKPLIRLRVEYQGLDLVRVHSIEQEFQDQVANPGEIMKFQKKKANEMKMNYDDNVNLNDGFIDSLYSKKDFNVLGSETHQEIIVNYSNNI